MLRIVGFILLIAIAFVMFKGAQLLLRNENNEGYKRIAYAVSGLWLFVPLALILAQAGFHFSEVDNDAWVAWTLLAVLPNAVFWGLIWILKGFRK